MNCTSIHCVYAKWWTSNKMEVCTRVRASVGIETALLRDSRRGDHRLRGVSFNMATSVFLFSLSFLSSSTSILPPSFLRTFLFLFLVFLITKKIIKILLRVLYNTRYSMTRVPIGFLKNRLLNNVLSQLNLDNKS